MAIRYPIAATVGYAAFLAALRIGVGLARRRLEGDVDPLDILDIGTSRSPRDSQPTPESGAEPGACDPAPDAPDAFDLPLPDIDDGAFLLVPLLILGAGLLAAIYVVYVAPALIAELILDVVIISSLARRFRHIEPTNWVKGAVRRTAPAFLGVLVIVTLLGFLAQHVSAEADSIGDVFRSA